MRNDDFARTLETHMTAITRQIAIEAIGRNVPGYADKDVEQLAVLFEPTVAMIIRYVRTGDPAEYRDYAANLTETRMSQGYDTKYIVMMGQILNRVLNSTIAQTLPGPEYANDRATLARRRAVIEQVGDSAVAVTRLKRRTAT